MHRVLVEETRWLDERTFLDALNFCMLLPGPEAMQLATYAGWRLHGWRGGLVAGLLFVVPGLLVILALATLYVLTAGASWFDALFLGLKAAVVVIVIEAVIRVGRRALKDRFAVMLAALAFLAIFAFGLPFPLIVLGAGIAGYARARRSGSASPVVPPATAPDGGRGGEARRLLLVSLVWGAAWGLPFVLIAALGASETVFAEIAAFFSKMAVVTFGGAYAVLAYVAQEAVETYRWIAPAAMLDGLGLAETTPGPLILVLVFVAFLAGHAQPAGLAPLAGGLLAGLVAAWVTFVPCFLWIFLGAPHIERIRRLPALSAALAGITAAVVGVILNLGLWFALHTLFADVGRIEAGPLSLAWPDWRTVDAIAAAMVAVALLAHLVFHWETMRLVGLGLLMGAVLALAA